MYCTSQQGGLIDWEITDVWRQYIGLALRGQGPYPTLDRAAALASNPLDCLDVDFVCDGTSSQDRLASYWNYKRQQLQPECKPILMNLNVLNNTTVELTFDLPACLFEPNKFLDEIRVLSAEPSLREEIILLRGTLCQNIVYGTNKPYWFHVVIEF